MRNIKTKKVKYRFLVMIKRGRNKIMLNENMLKDAQETVLLLSQDLKTFNFNRALKVVNMFITNSKKVLPNERTLECLISQFMCHFIYNIRGYQYWST